MTTRLREPLQGNIIAIAAVISLALVATAPALASTDRDIGCDESAVPTLEVAGTEFTAPPRTVTNDAEATEVIEADNGDTKQPDADAAIVLPTKGSQLVYKRQMYRRDI